MADQTGSKPSRPRRERLAHARAWVATRLQFPTLAAFARLRPGSAPSRALAWVAQRAVGGYPYGIKIELNDACNLRCRMCYVPRAAHELERASIDALLDELRGLHTRIELMGGEPLLRADLPEIVARAKAARLPFVSVYTNGTLATPALAQRLQRAGLDAALVTLVSHRAAVHDAFTGVGGSHERTLCGLRALRAAGIRTYSFTPIHNDNVDDVRELDRFARDELGVRPVFYQYVPQRAADPLIVSRERWREIKRWVLLERNPQHARFVAAFCGLTGCACSGGDYTFTVKVDGTVQPCPFISDIPLGDIHDTPFLTIFRRRREVARLRELKRLPAECAACSHASACGGGCRAGHTALYGSYAQKDHRCLGPYAAPVRQETLCDHVPTFF